MSDPWINRLVVAGPVEDIRTFAKTAIGFESSDFGSSSSKPTKLSLSFTSLYDLLSATARKRVPPVDEEPADLKFDRLVTGKNANGQKTYKFMLSSYDPDLLLIEVSKVFSRLCFILGWVAPSIDEAVSKFITKGAARRYRMSSKRRGDIRASKYEKWGEECLDADIEADWDMLDEVVSHWYPNLTSALKGIKRRGSRLQKRPR